MSAEKRLGMILRHKQRSNVLFWKKKKNNVLTPFWSNNDRTTSMSCWAVWFTWFEEIEPKRRRTLLEINTEIEINTDETNLQRSNELACVIGINGEGVRRQKSVSPPIPPFIILKWVAKHYQTVDLPKREPQVGRGLFGLQIAIFQIHKIFNISYFLQCNLSFGKKYLFPKMPKNHPKTYTKPPTKHRDLALESDRDIGRKAVLKRHQNSLHVYPRLNCYLILSPILKTWW